MLCFLCGKDIGWLRSMVDQQYCSAEHRREARLASTRVMREEEDEQEPWSVARNRQRQLSRSSVYSNQASAVAFVTLAALLVAMVMLPGAKNGQGTAFPPTTGPVAERGLLSRTTDTIGAFVRNRAP